MRRNTERVGIVDAFKGVIVWSEEGVALAMNRA
jgi:hypothetical protein